MYKDSTSTDRKVRLGKKDDDDVCTSIVKATHARGRPPMLKKRPTPPGAAHATYLGSTCSKQNFVKKTACNTAKGGEYQVTVTSGHAHKQKEQRN